MKKVLLCMLLFCTISFLLLDIYGPTLRDLFSPDVQAGYPYIAFETDVNGIEQLYLVLPEDAVYFMDGKNYVCTLQRSGQYPEEAYVAEYEEVVVEKLEEDQVYILPGSIEESEFVVFQMSEYVEEGERVCIIFELNE